MKIIIILVLIIAMAIPLSFDIANLSDTGFFENYSDWHEEELPTDTILKAKVKLPYDWHFATENDKIYIKDSVGKIIATEVYDEWRVDYHLGANYYDNKDSLTINSELPKELQNLDNYVLDTISAKNCYRYRCVVNEVNRYAIKFSIMTSNQIEGTYTLLIVFDEEISDEETFSKLMKSYRYGGHSNI